MMRDQINRGRYETEMPVSDFSIAPTASVGQYYQYPATSFYSPYFTPPEIISAAHFMHTANFGPGPSVF